MQAIILAAGMGKRLGDLTADNTKCMVTVNGVRLIDRMLCQLLQYNLSRIIIVTGYKGKELKEYIQTHYSNENIDFIENPVFDRTNNIYSLWLTKDKLVQDDTLLLESDLIFEDNVLEEAITSKYKDCALISKYQTWMDGTMVRIDDENNIVNFIPKKAFKYSDCQFYFKTVNIYKFSKEFLNHSYIPFLEAYINVLGENEYYEQVLRVITLIDSTGLKAVPISGLNWYEIDDIQDLKIAETIFASPKEKLEKLQHSFGGYWRYSDLLDFCYLVNPYFPKPRMIDEMKANFEVLLRDYPSGMGTNAMLASKYFGLREELIVVGNGAAELIKSFLNLSDGKIGVIYPTFEEYPNRIEQNQLIIYHPEKEGYKYDADDLINFFDKFSIKSLILINPDNPSGNFINKAGLQKLIDWSSAKDIRLLVDESFVDFAMDGKETSLLSNDILESNPNLFVMKSISKSYGVPGLRLGVLASGNTRFISQLKKDVAIWNINSFAEFYMQIYSKYEKDYLNACLYFKKERDIFFKELSQISFLKVFPSEANYFLCEVTERFSSYELTLKLLSQYNILIKDCGHKKGFTSSRQFVRIAIRDRKDNNKLYQALLSLL